VFQAQQVRRPSSDVFAELGRMKTAGYRKLIFFVDDNITSNLGEAKAFFRELKRSNVRWVSQMSINAAHDEEFLKLIKDSGCMGVLIGFESLQRDNLKAMGKGFNLMQGGYENALANLRRHGIRLYATFVFGYDADTVESIADTVAFAKRHRFYIAAFNHLTPFPGTPLYTRLQEAGRLLYDAWWLDPDYSYNRLPFQPHGMSADELQRQCLAARASFYSWPSILQRMMDPVNRSDGFMLRNFLPINAMLRADVGARDYYPLGDEAWEGQYLEACR
jgi:radical SAM superfamily enzyme YgiQ (UPF0313 family)